MKQEFFSFQELAERWRCSRGTVRNRLRRLGVGVLNFGQPGGRSKKAIPVSAIAQIEAKLTRKLP
jgi:hypothetical protein